MSDDLLERMTKALREEGGSEPSPERAALVRARVLSQTKRRAQLRPQGLWQWAAVVCLGFFVSTAMAHVIKVQLPRVIEALREPPAAPPKAAPKRKSPARPVPAAPAPEPAPEVAPVPAEPAPELVVPSAPSPDAAADPVERELESEGAREPTANAAPSAPRPQPAPARSKRPAKTAPRPAPKPPTPAPAETALAAVLPEEEPPAVPTVAPSASPPAKARAAESAELALFRRAQALHLSHDPKAIAAWDAYLRVAGTSALAPEARYNRGLGLVRAGRFAEAKKALAPFAEGKYGAYRREEARALLARLPE